MTSEHDDVWSLTGTLEQWLYGPKGELQGMLLLVQGVPVQFVVSPHDVHTVAGLRRGQKVSVDAVHEPWSPKGEAEHDVYRFVALAGGRAGAIERVSTSGAHTGKVVRFNYAKHGERNGVVLDNGDFIHTKPHGMALLDLKVGDRVTAVGGETRPLFDGAGVVVEAHEVNGIALYEMA